MSLTADQFTILKTRLSRTEGRRNRPYVDTVGKVTIGIGHNLTDRGLPDEIVDSIFLADITQSQVEASTLPIYNDLDPVRQTVIVDLVFNMGLERVKEFKNTLGYITRRDYDGAADELLLSTWAKQVGTRAIELATILRTGKLLD